MAPTVKPPRHFTNPILPGCYPDPSVCRVGADFYLVASSFEYFPGVPIFHSRDLVHWRQLGHVLTRKSQLDLDGVPSSGGIYAPTLRHDGGRFYMVTTHVQRGGNFYVTARRPEGPWSDPIWLDAEGIDPSFSFLGDTAYYTRNGRGSDADHPFIYQTRFDRKTGKLLGKPRVIWRGLGGIWPEAPHLYRFGDHYYLLTAEGGTAYDHSAVIARSKDPFGPFEPFEGNPILTHRDRRRDPIQATGHADLVEAPDGSVWAVLLGIRPKQGRHHHLGRETFLAPVRFTGDGWPVIGHRGRVPLEGVAPALGLWPQTKIKARDDFDQRRLGHQYVFLRNPRGRDWSLSRRPGHLRLMGSEVTLDDVGSPALVLRRQQHFALRCRALLEFEPRRDGEEAGLTVRANEEHHYDLAVRLADRGREAVLRARVGGKARVVGRAPLGVGPVRLEIAASDKEYAFRAGAGARLRPLGKLPTRALSAESISKPGKLYFTGAMIGMYATGNGRRSTAPADFDWFEYSY